VSVPCYLEPNCAPGSRFQLNSRGLPTRNGTWDANFDCIIPRSAVAAGSSPARPSLYGHGLFGRAAEVGSSGQRELANSYNFVLCATDEIEMSQADLGTAFQITSDVSNFPKLADRLQQGLLNELVLGRAMIHPQGLSSHPAFRVGTTSVIDTSRLYYDGNSQGGSWEEPSPRSLRLHAGRAGGARHEVLAAGPAVGRLRPVRGAALSEPPG
jgi:hypothetical protein